MEKIGFFEQLTSEFQTGTSIQTEQGRVLARKGHLLAPLAIIAGPFWIYLSWDIGTVTNGVISSIVLFWIVVITISYLYNASKNGVRHVFEMLDSGDAVLIQIRSYAFGFPKGRKSFSLSKEQIKLLVYETPGSSNKSEYKLVLQFESLEAALLISNDRETINYMKARIAVSLKLPEASVISKIELSKKSNFSRLLNPFRSHIQG